VKNIFELKKNGRSSVPVGVPCGMRVAFINELLFIYLFFFSFFLLDAIF
jgi:hypothetical protein